MSAQIEKLQRSLAPFVQEIVHHKVYASIQSIAHLQTFMRYHVYAVWDFMSLLKVLQINLTCTTLPWMPIGTGSTRSLINEIVAGEESDIDVEGNKKSHFEMYLDAMEQCGADTTEIQSFLAAIRSGKTLTAAFALAGTPQAARDFVTYTFEIINSGKTHNQAAVFTFGREDLIPDMFHSMVTDLNEKFPNQVSTFKYYLDRHIEVDGGEHSHLALQMTQELCEKEEKFWQEAETCSIDSLKQRIGLWDGVYNSIMKN